MIYGFFCVLIGDFQKIKWKALNLADGHSIYCWAIEGMLPNEKQYQAWLM
jgi:hypothetical protein